MFIHLAEKRAVKRSSSVGVSERPIRSLVKAISWRVTGSIDTMLLSWFFTGDLTVAAAIGLTEVITKMALYYLHERVWNRVPLGRAQGSIETGTERQIVGRQVNSLRPAAETE
jgi:uncharacterized membrane protein